MWILAWMFYLLLFFCFFLHFEITVRSDYYLLTGNDKYGVSCDCCQKHLLINIINTNAVDFKLACESRGKRCCIQLIQSQTWTYSLKGLLRVKRKQLNSFREGFLYSQHMYAVAIMCSCFVRAESILTQRCLLKPALSRKFSIKFEITFFFGYFCTTSWLWRRCVRDIQHSWWRHRGVKTLYDQ